MPETAVTSQPINVDIAKGLQEAASRVSGEARPQRTLAPLEIPQHVAERVRAMAEHEDPNSEQGKMLARTRERAAADKQGETTIRQVRESATQATALARDLADVLGAKGTLGAREQAALERVNAARQGGMTTDQIFERKIDALNADAAIAEQKAALAEGRGKWNRLNYADREGKKLDNLDAARSQELTAELNAMDIVTGGAIDWNGESSAILTQIESLPKASKEQRTQLRDLAQRIITARTQANAATSEIARLQTDRFRGTKDADATLRERVTAEQQKEARITIDAIDAEAVRRQGSIDVDAFLAKYSALQGESRTKFMADLGITEVTPPPAAGEPKYRIEGGKYDSLVSAEARFNQVNKQFAEAVVAAHNDPSLTDRVIALSAVRNRVHDERESARKAVADVYKVANREAIERAKRELAAKTSAVTGLERGGAFDQAWTKVRIAAANTPRVPGLLVRTAGLAIALVGEGLNRAGGLAAEPMQRGLEAEQIKREQARNVALEAARAAETSARTALEQLSQPV